MSEVAKENLVQASDAMPEHLCGYRIVERLPSTLTGEEDYLGPSYLGVGQSGRRAVLKPLDRDCLYKNGLHPSIEERLRRVRELALGLVANLYGVERDNGQAWLIWDYIGGRTFSEYARDPACTPPLLATAARELVLAVEAMHRQGIVHGAVRASNVIITRSGRVRLTHVSPLLYSDPGDDLWGVLSAIGEAADQQAKAADPSPLQMLVSEVRAELDRHDQPTPAKEAILHDLATRLGVIIEGRERAALPPPEPPQIERAPQRRSIVGAAAVLILGLGLAFGIWWTLRATGGSSVGWLQSIREGLK
jgi:hypothetical protein